MCELPSSTRFSTTSHSLVPVADGRQDLEPEHHAENQRRIEDPDHLEGRRRRVAPEHKDVDECCAQHDECKEAVHHVPGFIPNPQLLAPHRRNDQRQQQVEGERGRPGRHGGAGSKGIEPAADGVAGDAQ